MKGYMHINADKGEGSIEVEVKMELSTMDRYQLVHAVLTALNIKPFELLLAMPLLDGMSSATKRSGGTEIGIDMAGLLDQLRRGGG